MFSCRLARCQLSQGAGEAALQSGTGRLTQFYLHASRTAFPVYQTSEGWLCFLGNEQATSLRIHPDAEREAYVYLCDINRGSGLVQHVRLNYDLTRITWLGDRTWQVENDDP